MVCHVYPVCARGYLYETKHKTSKTAIAHRYRAHVSAVAAVRLARRPRGLRGWWRLVIITDTQLPTVQRYTGSCSLYATTAG